MTNNIIEMPLTPRFPNINKCKQEETNIVKENELASPFEEGTSCRTAKSELRSTEKSPAVAPHKRRKFLKQFSRIDSEYQHSTIKWARFTLWENEPGKYIVSAGFNWNADTNQPSYSIHFSLKNSRVRDFLRFGQGYEYLRDHEFYAEQKAYVTEERVNNYRDYEIAPRLTKGYLPKINEGTKSVEFSSFLLYKRFDCDYFEGLVQLGYPDTFTYVVKFNEEPATRQRNTKTGKALGVHSYRPLCRGKWKTKGMFDVMAALREQPQVNIVEEQ